MTIPLTRHVKCHVERADISNPAKWQLQLAKPASGQGSSAELGSEWAWLKHHQSGQPGPGLCAKSFSEVGPWPGKAEVYSTPVQCSNINIVMCGTWAKLVVVTSLTIRSFPFLCLSILMTGFSPPRSKATTVGRSWTVRHMSTFTTELSCCTTTPQMHKPACVVLG